jgi:hypothetical protein
MTDLYTSRDSTKERSRMTSHKQRRRQKPLIEACVTVLLVTVLWILFVGGTRSNEMAVGIGVLLVSNAFFYVVWRSEGLKLDLHLIDLIQCWRIPWYIFSGIYEIIMILLKDLFGIESANSFYRITKFKTSKSDFRRVTQRVLATFYTTMAPNFIVIGIDCRQNRMLFHQLNRSSVPKMTKALGAEPRVQRP